MQKSISDLWKKGNRMNDLKMTEQTISSLEVADMVEKRHKNLLRDIAKLSQVNFFETVHIKTKQEEYCNVLMLQRKVASSLLTS